MNTPVECNQPEAGEGPKTTIVAQVIYKMLSDVFLGCMEIRLQEIYLFLL